MPDILPIIDLEPLFCADLSARRVLADDIEQACRNTGFFYIRNHRIPEILITSTFAEVKRFFALPLAEKRTIAIEQSPCHRGYFGLGSENDG